MGGVLDTVKNEPLKITKDVLGEFTHILPPKTVPAPPDATWIAATGTGVQQDALRERQAQEEAASKLAYQKGAVTEQSADTDIKQFTVRRLKAIGDVLDQLDTLKPGDPNYDQTSKQLRDKLILLDIAGGKALPSSLASQRLQAVGKPVANSETLKYKPNATGPDGVTPLDPAGWSQPYRDIEGNITYFPYSQPLPVESTSTTSGIDPTSGMPYSRTTDTKRGAVSGGGNVPPPPGHDFGKNRLPAKNPYATGPIVAAYNAWIKEGQVPTGKMAGLVDAYANFENLPFGHTAARTKQLQADRKNVESMKSAAEWAEQYASGGEHTGPGDEALMDRFFELAAPAKGFRMTKPQQDMLREGRNWKAGAKAQLQHLTKGTWFEDQQRVNIAKAIQGMAIQKIQAVESSNAGLSDESGNKKASHADVQKYADDHLGGDYAKALAAFKAAQWTVPGE